MSAKVRFGRRIAVLTMIVAALGLTLAACGSGSSDSGSTSSSSGSSGGSSTSASSGSTTSSSSSGDAGLQAAQQAIDDAKKIPTFTAPGPAFDASKAKGKTILSIPVSNEIAFEVQSEKAATTEAKKLGINWITCQNQGKPSQWVACMNRAVSQKVDLIDLFGGTDPAELQPQLAAAKKAGIPVVSTHFYPVGVAPPKGVDATVPTDFGKAGKLDADWAIANGGKDGTTIVVRSSNLGIPEKTGFAAIQDEFKKNCPDCKVQVVDVASTDWASKLTPAVQSAITQNPDTKVIIPMYDSMSTFVTPALTSTGKTDSISLATFNGTPAFMKIIQDGGPVKMEVGEALTWIAYGMLDQEMRLMLGMQPLKSENLPLRVFDSSNIDDAGTPPTLGTGYGDAYQAGYAKLWGQSGQ